jgi:nicotinamide-nucleotide amidase
LLAKGAVQAEVAIAMAQGAAQSCSADIGVGCTGVAGPTAQDGRPVGEVHIAVVDLKNNAIRSHSLKFSGTRDEIRVQTCIAIFGLLLDVLVPQSTLIRP